MSDSTLASVNFEKYERLVSAIADTDLALCVQDPGGQSVWSNELYNELIGVVTQDSTPTASIVGVAQGRTIRRDLLDLQGDPFCTLLAVHVETRPGENPRASKVDAALCGAGDALADEYLLSSELDDMANELGERYEELNLIYGLQEQAEKYDPEKGRDVIGHLVADCVEFLDVDAAFFCHQGGESDMTILSESAALSNEDVESLASFALNLMLLEKHTMVINELDDARLRCCDCAAVGKMLLSPVTDVVGQPVGVLGLLNDATCADFNNGHRRLTDVLAEQTSAVIQATQDVLTGLLNRSGFENRLSHLLESVDLVNDSHAVLHLDLDQFQLVNDSLGVVAGDELLRQVALLLRSQIREVDIAARLGADEFAVILRDSSPSETTFVAERLLQAIGNHRFSWGDKVFDCSVTIGVVTVPDCGVVLAEVMSSADTACAIAKESGRNRIRLYDPNDTSIAERFGQVQWVPRIREAIELDRFELFAQPIVPISEEPREAHFEILLRLREPDGKITPPFGFIPAAERYQLMTEIDRLVVCKTLDFLSQPLPSDSANWSCAINLSGQSLAEPDFTAFVGSKLADSGVDPKRICFEVTETTAISNFSVALTFIENLKKQGCEFSLDDFGTGLSSFGYLQRLPVDYLKIDGGFVKEITTDKVSAEMVRCINQIGHVMGIKTIAEFVENDEIMAQLRDIGVDYAQGYGIGKPLPLEEQLERIGQSSPARRTAGGHG